MTGNKLRFLMQTNARGEIIRQDILVYAEQRGLREQRDYVVETLTESSLTRGREFEGGVLVVPPFNKFGFVVGIVGGSEMILDYLRRNSRMIKQGLREM